MSNKVLQYSYRDVVALRSLAYLRQRDNLSLQKIRVSIRNLRRLGKEDHLSRYKLVKSGQTVVVVDGDEAIDLLRKPGHSLIAELVDVFEEFEGRVGQVLPFQHPVPGVAVDPEIRGGFPVIEGTRVGYDQIAGLMADDVPAEEISRFFPSVTAEAARAAQQFAAYVGKFEDCRLRRPSRGMRILLDENVPEPLISPLGWLLRDCEIMHGKRFKGIKDQQLYAEAKRSGYELIVTADINQLLDPEICKAIHRSGLHGVFFETGHSPPGPTSRLRQAL